MIRRIIYVSRSLIGADPDGIADIVSSSVRWNTEVGVTGMLWADGSGFAQVFVGAPDKAGATMDRIRTDWRHTDINVLLDREILSRQFGSWSMRRAGDDEASTHGTAFLMGFARGERTRAAQRLYDVVLATGG
jgi:hypothetical protein